jgi:hypothetical protein
MWFSESLTFRSKYSPYIHGRKVRAAGNYNKQAAWAFSELHSVKSSEHNSTVRSPRRGNLKSHNILIPICYERTECWGEYLDGTLMK